jgi:uncharacterized membrane protein
MAQIAATGPSRQPAAAPVPTSNGEYITLLAHYHRAEIGRMAGWRSRIDLTTNWAITATGAMLSLSLSSPSSHHGIILMAMVLVTLFLSIEARRYRFFDVFRGRVRTIERNWFGPTFESDVRHDMGWLAELGHGLRQPRFRMSRSEALSRRLRRTYGWMYLILLAAWLLKTTSVHPDSTRPAQVTSFDLWLKNASVGPMPGVVVVAGVAAFYGWLVYIAVRHSKPESALLHGDVHV